MNFKETLNNYIKIIPTGYLIVGILRILDEIKMQILKRVNRMLTETILLIETLS